jgi:ubiquinone/menaquinone biosynthesis C-methylase UbiE
MGLYRKFFLPYLTDFTMRDKAATARRSELVPGADGIVLEIGIGSGLNLPFYSSAVTHLYAVDPSPELLAMTRKKVERMTFPVDLRCESAEHLSLDGRSVDTVVMTWALCTIPNPARALREMGRVLKPQGRMIFIEHGLSPGLRSPGLAEWAQSDLEQGDGRMQSQPQDRRSAHLERFQHHRAANGLSSWTASFDVHV